MEVEARSRLGQDGETDPARRRAHRDHLRAGRGVVRVRERRLEMLECGDGDAVEGPLLGVELLDRRDRLLFGRLRFDVLGRADLCDRCLLAGRDLLAASLQEGHVPRDQDDGDHAGGHDEHDAATTRTGPHLGCLRAPGGRQRTLARRLAEREGVVHACWYRHPSDHLNPGTIGSVSEIADVLAAIGSLSASGQRMALGAIEVFIEPADRAAEAARALRTALEEERPISLVTVIESSDPDAIVPGARLIVMPDGSVDGSLGRPDVDAEAIAAARDLLAAER